MVDGEIVIPSPSGLDFDASLQRIHPAESRVRMLAEDPRLLRGLRPLALGDDDLRRTPFGERRAQLEKV